MDLEIHGDTMREASNETKKYGSSYPRNSRVVSYLDTDNLYLQVVPVTMLAQNVLVQGILAPLISNVLLLRQVCVVTTTVLTLVHAFSSVAIIVLTIATSLYCDGTEQIAQLGRSFRTASSGLGLY